MMIAFIKIAIAICVFVTGWAVAAFMSDVVVEDPDYDEDTTNLALMIFAIGFTFGMMAVLVGLAVR